MYIEILDIHAAKPITIEGPRSLGREGGPADIPVPDERVSSLHAKIYPQSGRWFIEDCDSSNGTFVKGEQVAGAVELEEGMSFALCEYTFQVLRIVGTVGVDEHSATRAATHPPTGEQTETEADLSAPAVPAAIPADPSSANGSGTPKPVPVDAVVKSASAAIGDGVDEVEKQSFGEIISYQFSGVPKAFAHYLVATPKIAVNPLGTVKASVAQQTFPAFGVKEIVAYAIPPLLLMLVVMQLASIIVAIVDGNFAAGLIVTPLVMAVAFIVSAFVTGFLMHPILRWLVRILGGQSDARSRTNYFVTAYTAVPLVALGSGVAVLLSRIPVPYIGVITPILQLYASLVMLYVLYAWFKYFQVHKAVPIVVMVLAVLTGLGTIGQIVGVVTRGHNAVVTDVSGSAHVVNGGSSAAHGGGTDRGARGGGDPKATSTAATTTPTPRTVAGRSSFQEYKRRRELIITAIERDPPLLKLDGVAPLYREMLKRSYTAQAKYPMPKNPQTPEELAQAHVNQGLIEADTYRDTVDLVDRLYPLVIRE